MKNIKSENQILIMLAFFSVSMGLWENFRQLWLQNNNFSAGDISNIISIGTLISVIGILLVGKFIRLENLKAFVCCSLVVKFLNLILLFGSNNSGNCQLINYCIIIDVLTGYLVTTSIYPLITTIVKNNTIYSKRKLTEYLFKDIGVLIGGLLIGRNVIGIFVDYNTCLLISIVFLVVSVIFLINMTACRDIESKVENDSIIKYILQSKVTTIYMVYVFVGAVAFDTALGLKMLTLTNYFSFADNTATNYFLIVGLIADLIGVLALKYFTPKNDYITIIIKFGLRCLGYFIAFLSNNIAVTLTAITWSLLISTAYENITDGYYINSVENEYQLVFTNFRYMISYLGKALGMFLCGRMYNLGFRYMFGLSSLLLVFQIGLAFYLIYLRKHYADNMKSTKDKEKRKVYKNWRLAVH